MANRVFARGALVSRSDAPREFGDQAVFAMEGRDGRKIEARWWRTLRLAPFKAPRATFSPGRGDR